MTLELVPQGTLVERMRAGGTDIPAFYTPTAVGSSLAAGKDIRYFDGLPYVLERTIITDYAFVRAHRADRLGTCSSAGTAVISTSASPRPHGSRSPRRTK